jgi:hypothetical protein
MAALSKASHQTRSLTDRVHIEATNSFQVKNFWVLDSVPDDRARDELRVLHAQDGETKSLPGITEPEH